jgi:branched-chain amino acid transport system permease protein
MVPSGLFQATASGILQGGFFALAASGFSLIFGVQKILNIAHGAFIVLAAFVTIQFSIAITPVLHLDPLATIPIDFVLLAVFGGAVYFFIISRIESSGFEAPLLVTFGIAMMMEYVFANGLGPLPAIDPSGGLGATAGATGYSSASLQLGPVYLPSAQLVAFGVAIASIPLLHLFLKGTYYGRAIRATAQDSEAAEFSGIDTKRMKLLSFSVGSALAGVAGALFATTSSVTPSSGDDVLLPIIIVVVVLGGLGSISGTLAAGLLVGVVANVAGYAALILPIHSGFHADLGSLVTFSLFLGVLMLKPSGLFGKGERF